MSRAKDGHDLTSVFKEFLWLSCWAQTLEGLLSRVLKQNKLHRNKDNNLDSYAAEKAPKGFKSGKDIVGFAFQKAHSGQRVKIRSRETRRGD